MYTEEDIRELLREETETVEWKESPSEERFGTVVCALANDIAGGNSLGYLLFGVRNDGTLAGKAFTDQTMQHIANWRASARLAPPVVVNFELLHREGGDIIVVAVIPSTYPPVRFNNKVFVRVGPTTREADMAQENVLIERRRTYALTPDLLSFSQASLNDLNLDYFAKFYLPSAVSPEVLSKNERSLIQQMKSLFMISPDEYPTLAGILVLGVDPRQLIPGAYVQFIRIDGVEITDSIQDQKEISGRMDELLTNLDSLVDINIRTATKILDSGREERRPDYPKSAIMQALFNAIMHRTYTDSNSPVSFRWFSDRVEIQNPGGLFGQVTEDNFGSGVVDYRNPAIAEAMKNLGWIQRFGFGIQEIRRAMPSNGNPEPEFHVERTGVLVTLRS